MALDPLVFRPRRGRAGGRIRDQILARRAALLEELSALDRQVDLLVRRRHEITEELRTCRDAMGGIGNKWMPRDPLPGELDAEPSGSRTVAGRELRSALRQLLARSPRPLSIDEIHRGLLARGLRPEGRASKAISDALRWEIRNGRAGQVRRGEYVSVAA
jgi:hypothetical protein